MEASSKEDEHEPNLLPPVPQPPINFSRSPIPELCLTPEKGETLHFPGSHNTGFEPSVRSKSSRGHTTSCKVLADHSKQRTGKRTTHHGSSVPAQAAVSNPQPGLHMPFAPTRKAPIKKMAVISRGTNRVKSHVSVHPEKPKEGTVADATYHLPLSRPWLNSSMHIAEELKQIEDQDLDVSAELPEWLNTHPAVKQSVMAKISSQLNIPFDTQLFPGLISTEVDQDMVLQHAEAEYRKKRFAKPHVPRPKDPEPNILELFPPHHPIEHLALDVPIPPRTEPARRAAPLGNAYELYRRLAKMKSLDLFS